MHSTYTYITPRRQARGGAATAAWRHVVLARPLFTLMYILYRHGVHDDAMPGRPHAMPDTMYAQAHGMQKQKEHTSIDITMYQQKSSSSKRCTPCTAPAYVRAAVRHDHYQMYGLQIVMPRCSRRLFACCGAASIRASSRHDKIPEKRHGIREPAMSQCRQVFRKMM